MALWIDKNDYDFETEDQKAEFIKDNAKFTCPNCGYTHKNLDGALNCCHEDCYEQAKEHVTERNADERLRSEKGD